MTAPKPQPPKTLGDFLAPLKELEKVVTKKKPFVPQEHLTQKPFEDLDLKMYGQAAKGNRK